MQEVSPLAVSHSKNLTFDISRTLRDQYVDLNQYSSYSYIIDVDGKVYQSGSVSNDQASVILIGGVSNFVNEKVTRAGTFYITQAQKAVIYTIIRDLAQFSNDSQISSSNCDELDICVSALYNNYIG